MSGGSSSICRINKNQNYTIMSNYHLRSKNLSLKAIGLLSKVFSLPDDWDYSISGLVAICKESETAVKNALNELKEWGYLKVTKTQDAKTGYFVYTEYAAMSFQERHPNFYVFNSVIHKDGSDEHLHLNYIPFGHYPQKKLKVQNSHTRALIEMGYD